MDTMVSVNLWAAKREKMNEIISFGYWVRRRRKALDLTQVALAKQVGCATVTIKKIESDQRRPSRVMAERIAECLEIIEPDLENFIQSGLGESPTFQLPQPHLLIHTADIEPPFQVQQSEPKKWSTFVGRAAELTWLDNHFDQVLAGFAQIVFLSGGAGRGKTALMKAFAKRALTQVDELVVLQGNCNAFSGVADSFLPFREVLSQLTGDIRGQSAPLPLDIRQSRRLWRNMPSVLTQIVEYGPYLIDTFIPARTLRSRIQPNGDIKASTYQKFQSFLDQPRRMSDGLSPAVLFEQYTNVLQAVATQTPLLILLDDLQWADQSSIQLLAHIGQRLKGRILVIGTYRTNEVIQRQDDARHPLIPIQNELKRRGGDITIDLQQSDEKSGRDMVDFILDSEPNRFGAEFREHLFRLTMGHPLFIVELLRAMQNRGDIAYRDDCGWTTSANLAWEVIPSRIEAVLSERIDQLDESLRKLLLVASVEGEIFTDQVIAQVEGVEERDLLWALVHELGDRQRLIYETGEIETDNGYLTQFKFTHALYQEYLYRSLSQGEQRLLHREVALAIENLFTVQSDKIMADLAHHYTEAGWPEKAVVALHRAGISAAKKFANVEAREYFDQALAIISETDLETRWDLAHARVQIDTIERHPERKNHLEELESLALQLNDAKKQATTALFWAKFHLSSTHDMSAVRQALGCAFDLIQTINDPQLEARWHQIQGNLADVEGEVSRSIVHFERALIIYSKLGDRANEGIALDYLSLCYDRQGVDPIESKNLSIRTLQISREIGDQQLEGWSLIRLGKFENFLSDSYLVGEQLIKDGIEKLEKIGDRFGASWGVIFQGWSSLYQGDVPGALNYFQQGYDFAQEHGLVDAGNHLLQFIGEVAYSQGDYQKALAYFQRVEKYLHEHIHKTRKANIFARLGAALVGLKQWDEAESYFQKTLAIWRSVEPQMRMTAALSGMAEIELARDNSLQAQVYVDEIITLLESGLSLDATDNHFPARIRLTCVRVLQANQDPRADDFLQEAFAELQQLANKIDQPERRRVFLNNTPWHREIMSLMGKRID